MLLAVRYWAWLRDVLGRAGQCAAIALMLGLCAARPVAGADFSVTNSGFTAYVFSGAASGNNPTLTLTRGTSYTFEINAPGHPFWIKSVQGIGTANGFPGVINNGLTVGTITWTVPLDAPDTLFYNCEFHSHMTGTIQIRDVATSTPTQVTPNTPTITATATPTNRPCPADCNQDRTVSIDELLRAIDMVLGRAPTAACVPADVNLDGRVTIDELVAALRAAGNGCPR